MITLRPATSDDLPLLLEWDQQPHVIDSDPSDDWDWETELVRTPDWREQLMAEWNGRPVGFIQIIDPDREVTRYWGETGPGFRAIDIWIGWPEDLGKGYGSMMMKQAITRCFSDPLVHTILIDPLLSNIRAQNFYKRLGFKPVGELRFNEDDCLVMELKRSS